MLEATRSEDLERAVLTANALASVGAPAKESSAALLDLLHRAKTPQPGLGPDVCVGIRRNALRELSRFAEGPGAFMQTVRPVILEALRCKGLEEPALDALGAFCIRDDEVMCVVKRLFNQRERLRFAVFDFLAALEEPPDNFLQEARQAVEAEKWYAGSAIEYIAALAAEKKHAQKLGELLIRATRSREPDIRLNAVKALRAPVPGLIREQVEALIGQLNAENDVEHPHKDIVWEAVRSLGKLGPVASAAIPKLRELLEKAEEAEQKRRRQIEQRGWYRHWGKREEPLADVVRTALERITQKTT